MARSAKGKTRADELLVEQGMAETRSKARALILAGDVRVGDHVVAKPGELLDSETALSLTERHRYVSRGGLKLEHAMERFDIRIQGRVAADIGASTGGFTDYLLQRGAVRVYAIDVGYGQLAYSLRSDERVVVMERVNARYLESLPELVDLVTIDVSFISLQHILPIAVRLLAPDGDIVALIKPQFEAGRDAVSRRGVVTDSRVRYRVVVEVASAAVTSGLGLHGLTESPVSGPAGNVEYLGWFKAGVDAVDIESELGSIFGDSEGDQDSV